MLFNHFCPPCQEIFEKWMINRLIDFCKVAITVNITDEEIVSCGLQFESFSQPLNYPTAPKAKENGMDRESRSGSNAGATNHCAETNKTQSNPVTPTRVSTHKDWELRFWANMSKDANIDFNSVKNPSGPSLATNGVNVGNRVDPIYTPIQSTPAALASQPEQDSCEVISKRQKELSLTNIPVNETILKRLPNDVMNSNANDGLHLTGTFESLTMENSTENRNEDETPENPPSPSNVNSTPLDSTSTFKAFGNWSHPIYDAKTDEIVHPRIVKEKIERNFSRDRERSSQFTCKLDHVCRRSFGNLSNIRNHIFVNFFYVPCPNCKRVYKQYYSLEVHLKKCVDKGPKSTDSGSRYKRSISVDEKCEKKEKKKKVIDLIFSDYEDESSSSDEDEKHEIVILRLPEFMINSDEPASELDQIYSSFTESALRKNSDYRCVPTKKPDYVKPAPASKKLLKSTE